MNDYIHINDVFTKWKIGDGIVSLISENNEVPWKNQLDYVSLDFEYHGNNSGLKIISPLLENMLDNGILSDQSAIALSKVIYNMYKTQWDKLYSITKLSYNPIENYNRIETLNITENNTGTVNNKDNTTYGKKLTSSSTANATQNNDVYGFNSIDSIPSDKQNGNNKLDGSETYSGTDSIENLRTDNLSHEIERNSSISGNIGVATSQQMLESEINLWKWNFFNNIFKDIDKVLCINIY